MAKAFSRFFQTGIHVSRGDFPGKLFSTNQIFNLIYFPLEHFFPKDDKKNRQIRHSCISGGQKRFLKKTVIWKNQCFLKHSRTLRNNFPNFCRKTLYPVFKTTFYVSFYNILGKTADLYGKLFARFSKRHSTCPVELLESKKLFLGTIYSDSFCCMILSKSVWVSQRKTRQVCQKSILGV